MDKERVFGLDLMRACAILLVVFAHSSLYLGRVYPGADRVFGLAGYAGVELFFVLSGFLIGGIILRLLDNRASGESPGSSWLRLFWLRRWFRTLPNYFLFLAIHYLLWSWMNWRMEPIALYAVFLQTFEAGGQAFFPVSWSLAIEEWFYLLFPFALWLSLRLWPAVDERLMERCLATIMGLLLVFIAIRYALVIINDPDWSSGVRLRLVTRLDAPMYGVLAAYIARHHPREWLAYRWHALVVGLGLFALGTHMYFSGASIGESFAMKTLFFSLMSVAFACWLPAMAAWRSGSAALGSPLASAITLISLWSYSLYLCHDVIRRLVFVFAVRTGVRADLLELHLLTAAYMLLSIGVAAMVYKYFEHPMTRLRERFS